MRKDSYVPQKREGERINRSAHRGEETSGNYGYIPGLINNNNPHYGHLIFECSQCGKERIYGYSFAYRDKPENKHPRINCMGPCHKLTIHIFVRVHGGVRGE